MSQRGFSLPLSDLAPTLFPFFRHTIPNVRLAVVKTLASFMTVSSLPRDWIATPFLRLLFQNLIVEERSDIRAASLSSWRTALEIITGTPGLIKRMVKQQTALEWYAILMTPLGVSIDTSTFHRPTFAEDGTETPPERHNVDRNMLVQDLSLVSSELILQARIAAATALAYLIAYWPSTVCDRHTLRSTWQLIRLFSASKSSFSLYLSTTWIRRACFRSSWLQSLPRSGHMPMACRHHLAQSSTITLSLANSA